MRKEFFGIISLLSEKEEVSSQSCRPHQHHIRLIWLFSHQDARRATELEAVMEKQKMKVDLKLESSTL